MRIYTFKTKESGFKSHQVLNLSLRMIIPWSEQVLGLSLLLRCSPGRWAGLGESLKIFFVVC